LVVAAAPALVGVLLPISHVRRPLVPAPHQDVLLAACLALIGVSLAIGLYYALKRVARLVCERFDERHNELTAKVEALHELVGTLVEDGALRHRLIASGLAKARRGQRSTGKDIEALGEGIDSLHRHVLAIGDAFVEHGLPTQKESLGSRLN
jgi:hypothetical protein